MIHRAKKREAAIVEVISDAHRVAEFLQPIFGYNGWIYGFDGEVPTEEGLYDMILSICTTALTRKGASNISCGRLNLRITEGTNYWTAELVLEIPSP